MTPEQIKAAIAQGYTPESLLQYLPGWTVEHIRMAVGAPPPPVAPAASVQSAFEKRLAEADYGNSGTGRKLPPGRHVVDMVAWTYKDDLENGDRVIVEYDAVESTNPETEIGGRYSWPINLSDKWGYGLADIKGLVSTWTEKNVPGATPRQRWETRYYTTCVEQPSDHGSHAQPTKGSRWSVVTTAQTSKAGQPWTKHEAWDLLAPGTTLGLGARPSTITTAPAVPLPPVAPPPGLPLPPPMPSAAPAAPSAPPKPPGWDATGLPWPPPGMGGAA